MQGSESRAPEVPEVPEVTEASETTHESEPRVPRFLILVYSVIAAFMVYYIFTGLKFGMNSPTGF